MSRRIVPSPGRLLVSVIYHDEKRFAEAASAVRERLGPTEKESEAFPFNFTEYYEKEMGSPLYRKFLVMDGLVARETLAASKLAAEELENRFSAGGKRTVNIDPGLLTEENFILATGKNYSHRIYLRDGVFADLTLLYRKGEFQPLPWTYPDLASDGIRKYLGTIRAELREARRSGDGRAKCGSA